jgi:hypothetical protein
LFKIESDGQMKINQAKPLDYETATSHTLKIQVTDNGVPMLSNLVDATVVINVINVNEAPILNTAILTVDENSARNVLVGAPLVFVEPDAAQVHSFTIENGNSANFFTINSASGQISVNQVGLDYETTPTYSLTVKVTDSGDPSLSDTASITIIVNDLNDAPLFGAYVPQLNLEIGENVEQLIEERKPGLAFTLGGMGSAKTNFYNDAFSRAGYADAAEEVQRLWIEGKKPEAIRRVPDEMVLKTSLIGTEDMIRERLRAYRDAGVDTIRLGTGGKTWKERLDALDEGLDLFRRETAEWAS